MKKAGTRGKFFSKGIIAIIVIYLFTSIPFLFASNSKAEEATGGNKYICTNPIHTSERMQDKPGVCSDCGAKLKEIEVVNISKYHCDKCNKDFSTTKNLEKCPDCGGELSHNQTISVEKPEDLTHRVTLLIFQLFFIIICAKLVGELTEKYLKQPSVLGELVIGMLIGPFALGGHIHVPFLHTVLFPSIETAGGLPVAIAVSPELWSIAQIAVVLLLFLAGMETDKEKFFKYGLQASVIAIGGVILPFVFGAGAYAWYTGSSFMNPTALFMGAIMTATSVGITARILSDIHKIDTAEGVSILAAAVIDDVLGILVLAIVVGIAEVEVAGGGGGMDWGAIGATAGKAFGVWVAVGVIFMLLSKKISKIFLSFKSEGASLALAIGLCYFVAAVCEMFGLALIIGAYMLGLALSGTELDKKIQHQIKNICDAFVPIFFVVMGMLVNFNAMAPVLEFGLIITGLAIIGKVAGCGAPALIQGFNMRGAWRIGMGMLPRGEVALIVAGVGLAKGIIDQDIFGVSIMMTFITTLMSPIFLVPLFKKGGTGVRHAVDETAEKEIDSQIDK